MHDRGRWTRGWLVAAVLALAIDTGRADGRSGDGMVLRVDRAHGQVTVSTGEIRGVREAGVATFTAANPAELEGLAPGAMIGFAIASGDPARIEHVRARRHAPADAQGLKVEQLALAESIAGSTPPVAAVRVGERVPAFTLVDSHRRTVTLSEFSGRLVAVSFMYTSCHLPDYCFRLTNNFSLVQKRFADRLGRDLVLLTITFDPIHDQPEVLARYGATWKVRDAGWRLLGGAPDEVRRVCRLFGVNAWPEMGMMAHDLRTAVIDREGRLAAQIEGNEFTGRQLGDLIAALLD